MSVVRTIVGTIATKGAGFLVTLLVGVTIWRTLGPAGKGAVDALVAWAALLLLTYPSLEEPQLYLIGRGRIAPGTFLANGILVAIGFGLLTWGVFEFIVAYLPNWLEYRDRDTGTWQPLDIASLRLLVFLAPLVITQKVVGGVLQGLKDMKAFNLCFLIQNLVLLVGALTLVLFAQLGIEGAIYSHMASMGAGGLCALFFCFRNPSVRESPVRPDLIQLGRLIVGGLRIHGGVIAAWLIVMSDQILVMRFWGAKETGWYALAVGLSGHLRRLVLQPIKEVLGSRLPDMVGDPARITDAVAKTCRHTILLTLVPGAMLAAFGWPAIWVLYGADALPAYAPLLILLPGSLMWAAAVIISYWFIGRNRFLTLTLIGLFIGGSNIVLNFMFVPGFGRVGAAATSAACYGLHLTVFVVFIRWSEGTSPGRFLVPRREDFAVYGDAWRKLRERLGGSR
ncbi:MAG: hypothetical protein CMJ83_12325 [Planctomycetes bacterium]|nr:hypothetical protein [Planctomycetota bacterium]